MGTKGPIIGLIFILGVFTGGAVYAHVPYLEEGDYSFDHPFVVQKTIEQSIAVYSWLDFEYPDFSSADVDAYAFTLTEPAEVFLQAIVPACHGYENFAPWFALVGPGLPEATEDYPFKIPTGDGVVVTPNIPSYPRETFYEPFGNQTYFDGPIFNQTISTPGDYKIFYWDPDQMGGDYCAIIGDKEIWELDDIFRALIVTPKIRRGEELHLICDPPVEGDDDTDGDDDADDDTSADDDSFNPPTDDSANDDTGDDTATPAPENADSDNDSGGKCGC